MRKMEKERICEKAQKELMTIMEGKELTSNGVENASKLVDIIKDIKNMEYWDVKCEYYETALDGMRSGGYSNEGNGNGGNYSNANNDYDNGNSYRRGRNQRTGEYMHRPNSRLSGDDADMDEYRSRKREYSNARNGENKERMLDSLDRLVGKMCDSVAQFYRDCDCPEERDIIEGHLEGLQRKIKR